MNQLPLQRLPQLYRDERERPRERLQHLALEREHKNNNLQYYINCDYGGQLSLRLMARREREGRETTLGAEESEERNNNQQSMTMIQ